MKAGKSKESGSPEKEMKRLIRKPDNENDSLNKILKITVPAESIRHSDPVKRGKASKKPLKTSGNSKR